MCSIPEKLHTVSGHSWSPKACSGLRYLFTLLMGNRDSEKWNGMKQSHGADPHGSDPRGMEESHPRDPQTGGVQGAGCNGTDCEQKGALGQEWQCQERFRWLPERWFIEKDLDFSFVSKDSSNLKGRKRTSTRQNCPSMGCTDWEVQNSLSLDFLRTQNHLLQKRLKHRKSLNSVVTHTGLDYRTPGDIFKLIH